MRVFGIFAGASLGNYEFGLPRPVLRAIEASDVVVILNSDLAMLFDQDFIALLAGNTRIAWVPYLDEDSFTRLLPNSRSEAMQLHELTTAVGEICSEGGEALVDSGADARLQCTLGDHRVNWGTGTYIAGKGYGGLDIWPGGQVSRVPNARSANGRLVIDRSISAPEFRELRDPIELTVEAGYVTRIDGGHEAHRLEAFLASREDNGEAFHLTELGLGTNRLCQLTAVAGPSEDTHTLGCVSFALGADTHLGGDTRAGCHVDMTIHAATLTLNDRILVENGVLRVP